MRVEDIGIYVGEPDFPYKRVRRLEAKCEAATAFSGAPTMDEVNAKLREMAVSVGANAVIDVEYNSGVSLTSWRSMKGTGLAVIKESDEIACPVCAETIKRAASKCRFCGADLQAPPAAKPALAVQPPQPVVERSWSDYADDPVEQGSWNSYSDYDEEPLRSTNNPQIWIIAAVVVSFLLMMLAAL